MKGSCKSGRDFIPLDQRDEISFIAGVNASSGGCSLCGVQMAVRGRYQGVSAPPM